MRKFLFLFLLCAPATFAAGGACPAGVPVTGNNCYFAAANGSDTNNGTSEATPWAHFPGMPSCANNCLAEANGTGGYTRPSAGNGFIFRGGDTWHFGNHALTPTTGGQWLWGGGGGIWSGTAANCDVTDNPAGVKTSCIYIGVDKTWFSGGSWSRPVMNDDNPLSLTAVASCAFPTVGTTPNTAMRLAGVTFVQVDNLEWTGQCNQLSANSNVYILSSVANSVLAQNIFSNNYAHGFTHVAFSCPGTVCESNTFLTDSVGDAIGPGNVCDGADSDPTSITCLTPGGGGFYVFDNVFINYAQYVANGCHNYHDNLFTNYTKSGDGVSHGNQLECNSSSPAKDSNGHFQPTTTANLFYNNILGHNPAGNQGDIMIQLCVNNSLSFYIFNNIIYDQQNGNNFNLGGTGCQIQVSCTKPCGTVGTVQQVFNNTWDLPSAGMLNCFTSTTYTNNHFVVDGGAALSTTYAPCPNGPGGSVTNTSMTHATAVSQGYMAGGTGTSGNNSNVSCANDTTPCAPTAPGNSTVGAGTNLQSVCSTLLASSDPSVVRAGLACQNGTTDACAYNSTTHSVSCPRVTPVTRPTSAVWDTGAYGLTATVTTTPVNLAFGNQPMNVQSAGLTTTITNNSGATITFTGGAGGATFSGTNSTDFAETDTCGTTLTDTSSCVYTVKFTPSASIGTNETATMTVTWASGASTRTVSLTGTSSAAATLTPASENFGSVNVGTSSASQTATFTNISGVNLTVTSVTYTTGTNFSTTVTVPSPCGVLANNATCTISTIFLPTTAGALTDTLNMNYTGAGGSPLSVALSGTGVGVTPQQGAPTQKAFAGANLAACPPCVFDPKLFTGCFCFTTDGHLYSSVGKAYSLFATLSIAPVLTINGIKPDASGNVSLKATTTIP